MFYSAKSKFKKYSRIAIITSISLYLIACGGGVTGNTDNFIIVNDQSVIELNEINIANATLKTDAWIVIYEQDTLIARKSDRIIGKLALAAGDHENISLILERDVAHGEILYAELRRDDGDVGIYEPNIDSVISQSTATAASFVTNYSAVPYIAAVDQSISNVAGNTLQIKKVISTQRAWLVAYRRDNNAPNGLGEEIGHQRICHEEASTNGARGKIGQPTTCGEDNSTHPIHLSKVLIGLEKSLSPADEIVIVLREDAVIDDKDFLAEEDGFILVDGLLVSAQITIQ